MQKFERNPTQVDFADSKQMTEQSHAKACDINEIMKQYTTRELEAHVAMNRGNYADLSSSQTLHQAMNILAHGQQLFESIPAEIRAEFRNDVGRFTDWIQNPDNRSEIKAKGFPVDHLPEPTKPPASPQGDLQSPQGAAEPPKAE